MKAPRPISDLVHAHVGRPGIAIGGGMSLPGQMAELSRHIPDAVHVAANQHGCVMGYRVDYIVSVDLDMAGKMRSYGKPVITCRRQHADYMLFGNLFNNSGVSAAFVLWLMGCAPIIVSPGMDCFVGGTYCHDPKAKSSGTGSSVEQHLHRWQKLKEQVPLGAFRSAGGPTEKLFARYDPQETAFQIPTRERVLAASGGVLVEVKKPIDFLADRAIGDRVELSQSEARHAIGKRFAVKVGGAELHA